MTPGCAGNAYLPTALLWLAAAVPLLFFARLPKPVGAAGAGTSRLTF